MNKLIIMHEEQMKENEINKLKGHNLLRKILSHKKKWKTRKTILSEENQLFIKKTRKFIVNLKVNQ